MGIRFEPRRRGLPLNIGGAGGVATRRRSRQPARVGDRPGRVRAGAPAPMGGTASPSSSSASRPSPPTHLAVTASMASLAQRTGSVVLPIVGPATDALPCFAQGGLAQLLRPSAISIGQGTSSLRGERRSGSMTSPDRIPIGAAREGPPVVRGIRGGALASDFAGRSGANGTTRTSEPAARTSLLSGCADAPRARPIPWLRGDFNERSVQAARWSRRTGRSRSPSMRSATSSAHSGTVRAAVTVSKWTSSGVRCPRP